MTLPGGAALILRISREGRGNSVLMRSARRTACSRGERGERGDKTKRHAHAETRRARRNGESSSRNEPGCSFGTAARDATRSSSGSWCEEPSTVSAVLRALRVLIVRPQQWVGSRREGWQLSGTDLVGSTHRARTIRLRLSAFLRSVTNPRSPTNRMVRFG